jgi:pathogenesis-related protein 1
MVDSVKRTLLEFTWLFEKVFALVLKLCSFCRFTITAGMLVVGSTLSSLTLITAVEAQELVIKNRWRGTVITATEGAFSVRPVTNAANARWELVRVGPYVRIRSVATGHHLHIERGPLQLGPINQGWFSAMWNIESVGNSFVRIRNRWKSNLYLNIETGRLQASQIQPGWFSAMWQLEEPRGTAQPPAQTARQPARQPAQPAQTERPSRADAGARSVRQETLTRHNSLRGRHCVPPLAWSNRLEAVAQEWANRCVFEHRTGNLGENLAMGTSGAFPPASHVQSWYYEINSYDFANGRSSDGQAVGHFTQIVWRGTNQVGCAVATCNGQDMLVCNYSPAGNVTGRYTQNVPVRCR